MASQNTHSMIKHILKLIWNKKRANALLFTEIFFSFLIVFAGAAFCIKNFSAYFSPSGFDTEHIWIVEHSAFEGLDSAAIVGTKQLLKQELLALDGLEAASFVGYVTPYTGGMWTWGGDEMGFSFWTSILGGDEDINDVYQLNMVEGRAFAPEDRHSKYEPVIVNRLIRQKYWDDQPLTDSIIKLGEDEFKVVGVADYIRYRSGFDAECETMLRYGQPHQKDYSQLLLRVAPGSSAALEERVGQRLAAVFKTDDFTISSMDKARQSLDRETWIPIVIFLTVAGFIILNVALGLFGVLFYNISKRRGEIGVRMAMGAHRRDITRQFTLEVFFVALAAMLLGMLFAIQVPALELLKDEDFGHRYFYAGILFALVFVGGVVLLCAYWPSRQGARLNPATALHEE